MFWSLLFGGFLLVHTAYWLLVWIGFRRAARDSASSEAASAPLSVIVAARDEAARLPTLLQALAQQTHPHFEVVLVDDGSTDATVQIVRDWQRQHPQVRLLTVENPQPPRKKNALTLGIDAARYERLVFTDADCIPPPTWLARMARYADAAPDALFIGYSPFSPTGGVLGRLARYETFVTGVLTAAAAGLGKPFMAVGRNLSYPKTLFTKLGGFAHAETSMSGDDDLLVQEVHRRHAAPIRAVLDPETFVPTETPPTWRAWLRGKRRHLSAGPFYAPSVLLHLALFQGSGIVLWLAPLFLGWTGAALLGTKLLLQAAALYDAAGTLRERPLLPFLPLLDGLHAAYLVLTTPLGLRVPKRW